MMQSLPHPHPLLVSLVASPSPCWSKVDVAPTPLIQSQGCLAFLGSVSLTLDQQLPATSACLSLVMVNGG